MHTHETLLRNECNYTGYQPYWDEMMDADNSYNISDSIVFDPTTGFGGEGGDCVDDGPFSNITLHLTANWGVISSSDYCLSRDFNNEIWQGANSTHVAECMETQNFTSADSCFRSNPHTAGHGGVGGTMLDVVCVPMTMEKSPHSHSNTIQYANISGNRLHHRQIHYSSSTTPTWIGSGGTGNRLLLRIALTILATSRTSLFSATSWGTISLFPAISSSTATTIPSTSQPSTIRCGWSTFSPMSLLLM